MVYGVNMYVHMSWYDAACVFESLFPPSNLELTSISIPSFVCSQLKRQPPQTPSSTDLQSPSSASSSRATTKSKSPPPLPLPIQPNIPPRPQQINQRIQQTQTTRSNQKMESHASKASGVLVERENDVTSAAQPEADEDYEHMHMSPSTHHSDNIWMGEDHPSISSTSTPSASPPSSSPPHITSLPIMPPNPHTTSRSKVVRFRVVKLSKTGMYSERILSLDTAHHILLFHNPSHGFPMPTVGSDLPSTVTGGGAVHSPRGSMDLDEKGFALSDIKAIMPFDDAVATSAPMPTSGPVGGSGGFHSRLLILFQPELLHRSYEVLFADSIQRNIFVTIIQESYGLHSHNPYGCIEILHVDHAPIGPTPLGLGVGVGVGSGNGSGTGGSGSEHHRVGSESNGPTKGPKWIPDADVSECMGCKATFTMMFRKHHCLTEEHEVLTNRGFLGLNEIARIEPHLLHANSLDAVTVPPIPSSKSELESDSDSDPLLFASYDDSTRSLVYAPATRIIVDTTNELIEFTQHDDKQRDPSAIGQSFFAGGRVSVLVDPMHDMWVKTGIDPNGNDIDSNSSWTKQKAHALVSKSPDARIKMLAAAENGVQISTRDASHSLVELDLRTECQKQALLQVVGYCLLTNSLSSTSSLITIPSIPASDTDWFERAMCDLAMRAHVDYDITHEDGIDSSRTISIYDTTWVASFLRRRSVNLRDQLCSNSWFVRTKHLVSTPVSIVGFMMLIRVFFPSFPSLFCNLFILSTLGYGLSRSLIYAIY